MGVSGPVLERTQARVHELTAGMEVRRVLPLARRRSVGPWCFLDHFGPAQAGFDVSPHPHIGLQTVTWLLSGALFHVDSLGCEQWIRPGQLNWMTSGRGISHTEHAPSDGGPMHGVQLWVALPAALRDAPPSFVHHPIVPRVQLGLAEGFVLAGALAGVEGPAACHSPMLGADLTITGAAELPLDPTFEHAVMVTEGAVEVEGEVVTVGELLYLGTERAALRVAGEGRVMLLGGQPLREPLVMWWNFVGGSWEEIAEARTDWEARAARFGDVANAPRPRLAAPELPEGIGRR